MTYEFKIGMALQFNRPFREAVVLGRELGARYGWVDLDFDLAEVGDIDSVGKMTADHGIELFMLGNNVFSGLYLTDVDLERPLDNPQLQWHMDRLVAAMQAAAHLGVGTVLAYNFLWPGNWASWPMRWLTRGGVIAEIDLQKLELGGLLKAFGWPDYIYIADKPNAYSQAASYASLRN